MRFTGTVVSDGLRLRAGGGINFDVIDELTKGDKVELVSQINGDGWVDVYVLSTKSGEGVGEYGWINSAFITIDVPAPPDLPYPPVEPPPSKPQPMPETEPLFPDWAVYAGGAAIVLVVLLSLMLR